MDLKDVSLSLKDMELNTETNKSGIWTSWTVNL